MDKPLNISEQSYLLMALLFARHSLFDLLEYLPEKKQTRLIKAAEKMLLLPRPERIATAIKELKRLFALDEHVYVKLHPSWLTHALSSEPDYLKPYLSKKGSIAHHFLIDSLVKTPLKTPLFEPCLIKLQQQVTIDQAALFERIGQKMASLMSPYFSDERWKKFLLRRGFCLTNQPKIASSHALENPAIRSFCLKFSKSKPPQLFLPCLFIALVALYLKTKKEPWQETIKLSFTHQFGKLLEEALKELDGAPMLAPDLIELVASFITEEI